MIHAHSFKSFKIVRRILGLEEVVLWVAYHHEETGDAWLRGNTFL